MWAILYLARRHQYTPTSKHDMPTSPARQGTRNGSHGMSELNAWSWALLRAQRSSLSGMLVGGALGLANNSGASCSPTHGKLSMKERKP